MGDFVVAVGWLVWMLWLVGRDAGDGTYAARVINNDSGFFFLDSCGGDLIFIGHVFFFFLSTKHDWIKRKQFRYLGSW